MADASIIWPSGDCFLGCVLIVEDHALVREGMAQTLSRLGADWCVIEAPDAAHALTLLDDGADIDLVLTDIMLPGMNGLSLLATLRERDPSLPVIVVSALSDKATVARAMRQGASGFVSKGDSGDQLVLAVRTVLDGGLYTPPDRRVPAARAGRATPPIRPSAPPVPTASGSPRPRPGCCRCWPKGARTGKSRNRSDWPKGRSRCI